MIQIGVICWYSDDIFHAVSAVVDSRQYVSNVFQRFGFLSFHRWHPKNLPESDYGPSAWPVFHK